MEDSNNNHSSKKSEETAQEVKEKAEQQTGKEQKKQAKELTVEEKLKETEEKLLRSLAEIENQRRRFEKEIKDAFEFGSFNFAKERRSQTTIAFPPFLRIKLMDSLGSTISPKVSG